jgi:hypothetical protein
MDESGIHDGAPVVAVAGYISRPKDWRAWRPNILLDVRTSGAVNAGFAINIKDPLS